MLTPQPSHSPESPQAVHARRLAPHAHLASHLPGTPILAVHSLSVHYGKRLALDDVTFALQTGERVAVVGPNGAGKSTLFRAIAGVLAPSSGTIQAIHVKVGDAVEEGQSLFTIG